MKAYKGFDKDLKCRDFQFEIGKSYEEPSAELCKNGFHACENPLDCFGYYEPANSRYCEVELDDVSDQRESDSKICGKRITVGAEIGLQGIINAGVKFILNKVDWKNNKVTNTGNQSVATNTGYRSAATNAGDRSAATNTGYRSAATNTGDRSAATNTGNQSVATNTGYRSTAANTGDWSAATNTGDRSAATNTGNWSAATNTGNRSAATNTGDWSAATNTGNQSTAANTGDWSTAANTGNRSTAANTGNRSAAAVKGKESCAIALGIEGKAKGEKGCWLTLAEWKNIDGEWHRIAVKTRKVDGKNIKANTFYMLKNGMFCKVQEESHE